MFSCKMVPRHRVVRLWGLYAIKLYIDENNNKVRHHCWLYKEKLKFVLDMPGRYGWKSWSQSYMLLTIILYYILSLCRSNHVIKIGPAVHVQL